MTHPEASEPDLPVMYRAPGVDRPRMGHDVQTNDRSITIVLPAFNEAHRLPSTLERLTPWLDGSGAPYEIIVVDDGSTDETAALTMERRDAEGRLVLIESPSNRGKGAALAAGFAAARYRHVLFLDADLPVPTDTIGALIDRCTETGADLVIGTRHTPESQIIEAQPLLRRAGGWVFRGAAQGLGYRLTSDPQCGVKLLRRDETADTVAECTSERFAFDIELITRARSAGLSIVEVPVPWRHVEGSSLRPVRDAVITLRDLVVLRRRLRADRRR